MQYTHGLEDLLSSDSASRDYYQDLKNSACIIRKATLEDLPKEVAKAPSPVYQINMDSFSSLLVSIEGS
jgi:hypothetical protein